MTFGIFQDAYGHQITLHGSKSETGVIGTTLNGVMYLSMPFLSTILDSGRWATYRRPVALAGILVSSLSFLASSWSTQVWHLILLQGIFAALGGAMLFSPTTLFLDEWFRDGNRATAYSITLSAKNIVGTACPFLIYTLISHLGSRNAIRIWAGIVLVSGLIGLAILPTAATRIQRPRPRHIPWSFLRHRTFYIYALGNAVFSAGYGLPQTYLSQYATNELHLSGIASSLMIALFNAPGIFSCALMGLLCDRSSLSAAAETQICTIGSALCVFLLWGLKSHQVPALLIAFSIGFGFFAGPYSSVWGGWIKEIEFEALDHNEAINTGMVYGLLNGARGVGYVAGGLSGVELLKAGAVEPSKQWAYGTQYGAVILFTGFCSVLGGWSILWQGSGWKVARKCWSRVREDGGW